MRVGYVGGGRRFALGVGAFNLAQRGSSLVTLNLSNALQISQLVKPSRQFRLIRLLVLKDGRNLKEESASVGSWRLRYGARREVVHIGNETNEFARPDALAAPPKGLVVVVLERLVATNALFFGKVRGSVEMIGGDFVTVAVGSTAQLGSAKKKKAKLTRGRKIQQYEPQSD